MATKNEEEKHDAGIQVGPDLNCSRAPLDKKLYKQILLPNGIRAVLVSDVMAMQYMQSEGGFLYGDDDDESEEGEKNECESKNKKHHKMAEHQVMESDEDSEEGSAIDDGACGLRDAAASITVGVGSYSDPPDCLGMAHFLGTFYVV